jgi:hypothetical protein
MAASDVLDAVRQEWQAFVARQAPPPEPPRTTFRPSRAALFAELEGVRLEWAALAAEPRTPAARDTLVTPAWTMTHVVAHVASWAAEFRREAEAIARDEPFDYTILNVPTRQGPTEWNEREIGRRRGDALPALFDEIDRESERLIELVLTLPDDLLYGDRDMPYAPTGDPAVRWRGSLARVVQMKAFHDRHHLRRIRRELGRDSLG